MESIFSVSSLGKLRKKSPDVSDSLSFLPDKMSDKCKKFISQPEYITLNLIHFSSLLPFLLWRPYVNSSLILLFSLRFFFRIFEQFSFQKVEPLFLLIDTRFSLTLENMIWNQNFGKSKNRLKIKQLTKLIKLIA